MNWRSAVRPRRELVLPFLMAGFPILYFGYRSHASASAGCPSGNGCFGPGHAGFALAGFAVSYLLAVALVALVGGRALAIEYASARLAFQPDDETLVVLVAVVGAVALYGFATLAVGVPAWLDRVLTPVGLVVGLPFVAIFAGTTLVGSAVGVEPSLAVQSAVVAVSLALTAAWVFLLATGIAGLLSGTASEGVRSG